MIAIIGSSKPLGRFEEPMIAIISSYFLERGYAVVPHTTLNLAWRQVLSDVDILIAKGTDVIAIEVKSSRDKLARANQQLSKIVDYVDYAYVATDQDVETWDGGAVGLIRVGPEGVKVVRSATRLVSRPLVESLFALQKKCLSRMLGVSEHTHVGKYTLARQVETLGEDDVLRDCLKEITTCSGQCSSDCPIWKYVESGRE